jgi:ABC-2 type transport system ATP-binding protein
MPEKETPPDDVMPDEPTDLEARPEAPPDAPAADALEEGATSGELPVEAPDSEREGDVESSVAGFGAPVIKCDALSRWFGTVIAVNNLHLEIRPGITGLLGPNGAGKTTFMQLVMGLLRPSSGTLEVFGQNPWNNTRLMSRIGYVGEGDAPWRDRTGRECAMLAAQLAGLGPEAAEKAVDDALEEVALVDVQDRVVDGYSRGMRQRLKFALALLHDPELLILDEPLLGTDPETRVHLIQLIRDLERRGKSLLVSTHVLPDIEAMTDRIMLLNHGRLMALGDVAEIRDLLEQYPRTIRVTTPEPRRLGSLLWNLSSVSALELEPEAVRARTDQAQAFYTELQELLASNEIPFTSISSPDDTLEAIFQYLVE